MKSGTVPYGQLVAALDDRLFLVRDDHDLIAVDLAPEPHVRWQKRIFLPSDLPSLTLVNRDPLFSKEGRRDSDEGKKLAAALRNDPAARRDLAYIDSQLALLGKAGLRESTARTLHDEYARSLDGPLGSGRYGPQAKEIFETVAVSLSAGSPVAMSTKSWGSGAGTGPSGRENLQLVPGLASAHEYSVIGAREDKDGLRWIRVVNPWHHFSRRYDRTGGKLVARASSRRQDDPGAFDIELSDVPRYFDSVAYLTDR